MAASLYTLTSNLNKESVIPASEECFIREIEEAMGEKFVFRNTNEKDLCRTQIVVKAPNVSDTFLHNPFANHHIVSYV